MNPASRNAFVDEVRLLKLADLGQQPPSPSRARLYKTIAESALAGGVGYGAGTLTGSLLSRTLLPKVAPALSPAQLAALSHVLGAAVSGASMAFLGLAQQRQQDRLHPAPKAAPTEVAESGAPSGYVSRV